MEIAKPNNIIPIANPRLRLNQCDTTFTLVSINDPCPKNLRAPNPRANQIMPGAKPKAIQPSPRKITTVSIIFRAPYRSTKRPTKGKPKAAIRVASPYAEDIAVAPTPKSREIGPIKTLNV